MTRLRMRWLLTAGLVATALLAASVARAGAPLTFGPFTNSYSFIGMHCDGYDVLIEGPGPTRSRSSSMRQGDHEGDLSGSVPV